MMERKIALYEGLSSGIQRLFFGAFRYMAGMFNKRNLLFVMDEEVEAVYIEALL